MRITETVGKSLYHYETVSRWLRINYVTVTNRNKGLIYTVPEVGEEVPVFRYKNRRYYLDNFERLAYPIFVSDVIIGASEIDNCLNPLLLEVSDTGDYVRLWHSISD